jgi:hypothetical protein
MCKNDCILYHGPKYEDLEKCPISRLDRFNHRKDGSDEKEFWYFPNISRLKHWFANKE